MQACEQTPGQSIYDHGTSVWSHLQKLLNKDTSEFRLPQWYTLFGDQMISAAHDATILRLYATYHDCGKPYCLTKDADGRRHFPNHAAISQQTWTNTFGSTPPNDIIGELIGLDMIMHTETYDQIRARNLSNATTCSLLLAALAEIHSNAKMFGGIESTSFKIKWKRLDKLGMKLCKFMFDHSYMYVITRRDLSKPQQAVQAGHAMIEASRAFIVKDDEHPSLVLCTERDEGRLMRIRDQFQRDGIPFRDFHEPDIGGQLTALATAPITGDRSAFKKLQLMKGD